MRQIGTSPATAPARGPRISIRYAESRSVETDANGQFTVADVTNGQHFDVTGIFATVNTGAGAQLDAIVTARGTDPPSQYGWTFTVYELVSIAGGKLGAQPCANKQVVIMWAALGVIP